MGQVVYQIIDSIYSSSGLANQNINCVIPWGSVVPKLAATTVSLQGVRVGRREYLPVQCYTSAGGGPFVAADKQRHAVTSRVQGWRSSITWWRSRSGPLSSVTSSVGGRELFREGPPRG